MEEIQDQQPRTPEMHMEEQRAKAVADFKRIIAENPPTRQAVKGFLLRKATAYLGEANKGTSRAQRRLAARMTARRMAKRMRSGEDIFNASV